jgi:ferric-dicitrate binding protein FerR (iron transport regulator)
MDQPDDRSKELARKWLNGTITEAEKEEFAQWYEQDSSARLDIPPSFALSEEELQDRMLAHIQRQKKGKVVWLNAKRLIAIAAACFFLVAGSAIFYFQVYSSKTDTYKNGSKSGAAAPNLTPHHNIVPGGNKAVLILADGSEVVLDTATNGTVVSDRNTKVIKVKEGQVAFSSAGKPATVGYNTLSTPRGGQYAITLPDGTDVWLNSASSLHFPTAFTGGERVVELSGEAYFEVAKNAQQPFLVKLNGVDIKVLGTHFNIMAYADEEVIKTTLVEGAVQIQKDKTLAVLKPGQQAAIKQGAAISIRKDADVQEALAWKNGLFHFEGTSIETIMRQLARWYSIEVVYAGKVPDHFTGTISRNVGIEKVFRMLELTGAVRFSIRGNNVTVQP